MVLKLNLYIYFIFVLIPLYDAQPRMAWIQRNGEDLNVSPFEFVLSKLFGLTDNLNGIDNAMHTIANEEQIKVREDFDAVASKANEFLEQMVSFLDGNDERRTKEGNFKVGFGKGRSAYDKGTLTLGQHVCVREKKVILPPDVTGSACKLYKRAMRCVAGDGNETLIRIVECCDGYRTVDIRKGCTSYDMSITLNELLVGRNVCTNALEMKDTKFTTLLLPDNEFCSGNGTSERNWDEYILEQIYPTYELLNSQKLPTRKPGTFVIVSINPKQTNSSNDKPLVNCIKIADEDLAWKNGVVQLLSAPLPPATTQTLLDVITNNSDFSAFSDLLTDDLRERLASNDLISTVFVFKNETFASLSPSLRARMQQRKGCARDLIKEHIYDGMLCSALMEDNIKSITGIKHRFYEQHDVNNTKLIRLDNGRILDTDRVASNGVIHLIDDVIFSEQFVDWRDHLDFPEREFLDVVERNIGYGDEPVAIFVPPIDSFKNLTDEKSFILNHIVMGDSHITNKLIKTAYGSKIPSSMSFPSPTFGCARTIKPSMKYCNTTIYFIDRPLPIIENALGELISSREELSAFASLLNNSNIDLENDGPYTVFLPSNDALSKNQIRALRANETLADDFIRRHIFKGLLCSTNLRARRGRQLPVALENLKGEFYHGRTEAEKVTVGGINLQEMDVLAANGILHTLESSLQWNPPNRHHRTLCSIFDFS